MIITPCLELGPGDWHLFAVTENTAMDDLLHRRSRPQLAAKALDQFTSVTAETAKLRHHAPNFTAWRPGISRPAFRRHQSVQATVIG